MRFLVTVSAAAVTLLTCDARACAAKPQHIVSLSECTDDLLLDLVPLDRIASITYLSRSPSNSYVWRQAAKVRINYGYSEDILAERPDFVLAGTYTTPATRALIKRVGIPLLEVEPADNFDEIRAVTRRVARALGESARGEELLAKMDATLRAIARTKPKRIVRVAGWDGARDVPGRGSLFDAIVTAAGGVNIASAQDGDRANTFDIEQILAARPDVLAYGSDAAATPSLRNDTAEHPVILERYAHRRIAYPEALYSCGVPESASAAQAFQAAMIEAMTFPGP